MRVAAIIAHRTTATTRSSEVKDETLHGMSLALIMHALAGDRKVRAAGVAVARAGALSARRAAASLYAWGLVAAIGAGVGSSSAEDEDAYAIFSERLPMRLDAPAPLQVDAVRACSVMVRLHVDLTVMVMAFVYIERAWTSEGCPSRLTRGGAPPSPASSPG